LLPDIQAKIQQPLDQCLLMGLQLNST